MAKKKKKKGGFLKGLIVFIIVLAILGVIGYFGYASYTEVSSLIKEVENFSYDIPEELPSKVDLPTKIGDNITITWKSSNEEVLSSNGVVTPPTFEEEGKNVTLTGQINLEFKQLFSNLVLKLLNIKVDDLSYSVYIPATPATDEDKVNAVLSRLSVVSETYTSLNLPTTACYEGIIISWDSLNDDVMTDTGEVITPSVDRDIKLIASVESGSYSDTKEFDVRVLKNEKVITEINDHFDNQAKTSRYKVINSPNGVIYNNARILLVDEHAEDNETDMTDDINALVPAYVRIRNEKDEISTFLVPEILNPKTFSFKYRFAGDQSSSGAKLVVTITTNKGEIKEEILLQKEVVEPGMEVTFKEYTKNLEEFEKASIKVEFIDPWTGNTYVDIDEVKMDTNPTSNDLSDWLINNTPTKATKAIILPFTTIYGGKITWVSNNDALTNTGIVTKGEEAVTVSLTATINYLGTETVVTIEVKVPGKNSSEALEIFFIDIGKYGAGDCGESIYIKFGNTDIIVDAGDNFTDTGKAVTEAIKTRMQDDKIEYVIATHPDADHIGGMPTLFDNFEIETLIKFEGGHGTKKYDNFVESYTNEGCEVYNIGSDIITKGLGKKFITINNDIYIDFVDTGYYVEVDDKGKPMETNGRSIVFVLNAYGTRVLFTGDADNAPNHPHLEQNYMNEVGNVDILKVVHHGTKNGTDLDYLDVVDPEMAIICNGNYLGNKHGHPTPRAISNLYKHDPDMKVYAITGGGTIDGVPNKTNGTYKCSSEDRFNQRNGLITITIDNNGYSATSEYYNDKMMEMKNTIYYNSILANGLA